jgi:hypothetical protein
MNDSGVKETLHNLIRKILLWFSFWMAISLFFSSRNYFNGTGMGGASASYPEALRQALVQWLTWGVFSLDIIRLARWVAPGQALLQRLLWHLPLSFLVTFAFFIVAILMDALHFLFVTLAARKMIVVLNHLGHLLLRQPVPSIAVE